MGHYWAIHGMLWEMNGTLMEHEWNIMLFLHELLGLKRRMRLLQSELLDIGLELSAAKTKILTMRAEAPTTLNFMDKMSTGDQCHAYLGRIFPGSLADHGHTICSLRGWNTAITVTHCKTDTFL